jgi:hypothetical protein
MKLFGTVNVGFNLTDQLLTKFFAFVRYWRKMGVQLSPFISIGPCNHFSIAYFL